MRAWAIKHWRQGIYVDTVRRTRAEAIEAFKEQFLDDEELWGETSRHGVNRAVRVTVEVERR